MRLVLAIATAALATTAHAKTVTPPEPPRPDLTAAVEGAVKQMKQNLYDPESARIEWRSGFQWSYLKEPFVRREFGWIACGTINGKNRLGGYVGANGFLLFVRESGEVTTAYLNDRYSSVCDSWPSVAVDEVLKQSVLQPSVPTVADELGKLAKLHADGVLTDQEFAAQKAKLLSQ